MQEDPNGMQIQSDRDMIEGFRRIDPIINKPSGKEETIQPNHTDDNEAKIVAINRLANLMWSRMEDLESKVSHISTFCLNNHIYDAV